MDPQFPFEVGIALPEATQTPASDHLALRVTRLRGEAPSAGIETVVEHGSAIRICSVTKTITDCFKFRHKVGLDVALEALNLNPAVTPLPARRPAV